MEEYRRLDERYAEQSKEALALSVSNRQMRAEVDRMILERQNEKGSLPKRRCLRESLKGRLKLKLGRCLRNKTRPLKTELETLHKERAEASADEVAFAAKNQEQREPE